MTYDITLEIAEQIIIAGTPYLHFNPMNARIFELLVPAAQINPNTRAALSGTSYKLPTVERVGSSILEIPDRALPGFLSHLKWAGYVILEATDEQFAQIKTLALDYPRYHNQSAYYSKDGAYWTFGFKTRFETTADERLPDWHKLYYANPIRGHHNERIEPGGHEKSWLAVDGYYGTARKQQGSRYVTATKLTAEAFRTIDFLFHDDIVNLTTPRSTYRYIVWNDDRILDHVKTRTMYFQVSNDELKRLAAVTVKHPDSKNHVWISGGWYLMPSAMGWYGKTYGGEYPYRPADPRSSPTFTPPARPGRASTSPAPTVLRGNGITATYSEKSPGEPGWWWIAGATKDDTFLIRHQIKSYGCRWSTKRDQWFYQGRTLPPGLRSLLGIQDSPAANPPAPTVQTPSTTSASSLIVAPATTDPKAPAWMRDGNWFKITSPLDADQRAQLSEIITYADGLYLHQAALEQIEHSCAIAKPSVPEPEPPEPPAEPLESIFGTETTKLRLYDGRLLLHSNNGLRAERGSFTTCHEAVNQPGSSRQTRSPRPTTPSSVSSNAMQPSA